MFCSVIECEDISFMTVKVSFIYDKVYFIIPSTRYHGLPTRYHTRYFIVARNIYNIQHGTIFCAISDVSLFSVTMHFERNK